jgi:DNA polymerase
MNDSIHQSDLFAATPSANTSAAPPALGQSGSSAGVASPAEAVAPAPDPAADRAAATPSGTEPRQARPADPEPALALLAARCADCHRCGLAEGRQHVVVSRGNSRARLMVIGEGPGAQEDASGRPFVGRAGQLLDQMLASVGIDSERDAYIGNVVKCRPPDNRRPTPEEMAACLPFLQQQIALVDPAVILLAGATAMEGVLGIRGGITRLRGQWRLGEEGVLAGRWLMPVFHPSYLLRNASREQGSPKWLTWHDLKAVRTRLEQE